jgi:hypothetical protein
LSFIVEGFWVVDVESCEETVSVEVDLKKDIKAWVVFIWLSRMLVRIFQLKNKCSELYGLCCVKIFTTFTYFLGLKTKHSTKNFKEKLNTKVLEKFH